MTHPQLVRMFISQPSTHQPLHKLNGKRVLAAPSDEECWDVWFTDGDTTSMRVPRLCLGKGWPPARQIRD